MDDIVEWNEAIVQTPSWFARTRYPDYRYVGYCLACGFTLNGADVNDVQAQWGSHACSPKERRHGA